MELTDALFYILLWVIGACGAAIAGIIVSDKIIEPLIRKIERFKEKS